MISRLVARNPATSFGRHCGVYEDPTFQNEPCAVVERVGSICPTPPEPRYALRKSRINRRKSISPQDSAILPSAIL
jgi:hypothetical protein